MKKILSGVLLVLAIAFLLPFSKAEAEAANGKVKMTFVWTDSHISSVCGTYRGTDGALNDAGRINSSGEYYELNPGTTVNFSVLLVSGLNVSDYIFTFTPDSGSVYKDGINGGIMTLGSTDVTITIGLAEDTSLKGTLTVSGSSVSDLGNDSVKVGDSLTATLSNANSTHLTYKWYLTQNGTDTQIGTGATFTVPTNYAGECIVVKVTASDREGSRTLSMPVVGIKHKVTFKIVGQGSIVYDGATYTSDFDFKIRTAEMCEFLIDNGAIVEFTTSVSKLQIEEDGSTGRYFIMPDSDLTITAKFTKPEDVNLANAIVKEVKTTFEYDGSTHLPELKVTLNGISLGLGAYEFKDKAGNYGAPQKNAGTYYYKIVAGENSVYRGEHAISPFKITPNTSGTAKLKSGSYYKYTGKKIKPEVVVSSKLNETLVKGRDYTITYPSNPVAVGTYTIKVKFKGNYSGTKELTYYIATGKEVNVTVKTPINTYTGKNIKPAVTVKNGLGKTLKSGRDYTLTYEKECKTIGAYKVKVTLKGSYKGTAYGKYTIAPKGTNISKLAAKTKGIVVTWKKQTTKTDGYQLRYSENSNMSGAKTVTISKNSTVKTEIKNLKAKKTYYVQVCTYKKVGSKKICSDWSKANKITTK